MSNVLLITAEQHFSELLKEACAYRQVEILPSNEIYILKLLNHYVDSRNLHFPFVSESVEKIPDTFAELYLTALSCNEPIKQKYMKILADKSLYLSGFFADSLQKKSVDINYYMGIGSAAYQNLAAWTKEESTAAVYSQFSKRFADYADLLNYISTKSTLQSEQNILKLYERYIKTGSESIREKLTELGVVTTTETKERLKIKKI